MAYQNDLEKLIKEMDRRKAENDSKKKVTEQFDFFRPPKGCLFHKNRRKPEK